MSKGKFETFILRGYCLLATLLICILGFQNLKLKGMNLPGFWESQDSTAVLIQEVMAGAPSIGSNHAPIEVILFLEPECPGCLSHFKFCTTLERENPGQVQIIPLFVASSDEGLERAAACYLAGQKGHLENYLLMIQELKPVKTQEELSQLAANLGLDFNQFLKELETGAAREAVLKQQSYALKRGVKFLPSLMVNGELLDTMSTLELSSYFQKLGLLPIIQ